MKTKKNYKGECYDVSFNKLFFTSDGTLFYLKDVDELDRLFTELYAVEVVMHMANVGCVVFIENEPRDDDGLPFIPLDCCCGRCEEIYGMIERGECL